MAVPPHTSSFSRDDDKRRVLDATDIVRLVGETISLKQKGREYVGLCPFHDDHNPSMGVVPHKQIYHCFVCGAGGDALSYAMNYHKMSFREALEFLAQRAGITLTPWKPQHGTGDAAAAQAQQQQRESQRAAILRASATAATFFKAILHHPEHGAAARAIVERRGINAEMQEAFALGAAPDMWDGLRATILSKKLDVAPFLAAGLLRPRESGGEFDMFRNRLMFPIHDQIGRIIAFGGRRINDEDEPKYINSAEHAAFDKSSTLYGLHQGVQAIRKSGVALICEGYTDVIACHQHGVKNAVATLGTALTAQHAKVLRRLCDTVVLLFDGDDAGKRAAERAVQVFFDQSIDLRIATLAGHTTAKDPDELLKQEGGKAILEQCIKASIDPMDLLFRRFRDSTEGKGIAARARMMDEFLTRMVELGLARVDPSRFQMVLSHVSQISGVGYREVADMIAQKINRRPPAHLARPGASAVPQSRADRRRNIFESLIGCILCDPSLIMSIPADDQHLLGVEHLPTEEGKRIAQAIVDLEADGEEPYLRTVLTRLEDEAARRMATALESEVDHQTDSDPDRLRQHWHDLIARARRSLSQSLHEEHPADAREPGPDGSTVIGTDEKNAAALSVVTKLERLRLRRERDGYDPLATPRPMGPGGAGGVGGAGGGG